jgi:CDP-paratose 2-epimerase
MVQEYGRYFGMPTACFRGGCLTGANHSGAELHGFLAYLARCVWEGRTYRIFGYKGKQVRDNVHAYDVCTAFLEFFQRPRTAAVYNLGGGRANSISVLEAIDAFQELIGRELNVEHLDEPRVGDHLCYISNLSRLRHDYPDWNITRSLRDILDELARSVHAAGRR